MLQHAMKNTELLNCQFSLHTCTFPLRGRYIFSVCKHRPLGPRIRHYSHDSQRGSTTTVPVPTMAISTVPPESENHQDNCSEESAMSTGVGVSSCCLISVVHDGTPSVREETVEGLPCYVAEPKDNSKPKSIILRTPWCLGRAC